MVFMAHPPRWLRALYSQCLWEVPDTTRRVYLTFDDGPHPLATPFVLEQLAFYEAPATFFCIGKNVMANPHIYQSVLAAGHAVGNHTFHHLNGWKTATAEYLADIKRASEWIDSPWFRPPYGRITRAQLRKLRTDFPQLKPVMWSVLSGDFDTTMTGNDCFELIQRHVKPGSILVFHDSEKAYPRLQVALPRTLAWLKQEGYSFGLLPR